MIKVFKIKPIFLLLLPAFFCLHGWQENYSYIEPGEVFIIGLVAFLCLLGLYGIIYLLTKRSYVLASLMTAFIGTWYLFFGVFVDSLRKVHLNFFSSYSFLIPFFIVLSFILFFVLKRRIGFRAKLFYFSNLLLTIFCIIDCISIFYKSISASRTDKMKPELSINKEEVGEKPNVYFLLFDEYAGYKSLKDSFHYSNDSLINFLTENKFRILPYKSNYDFTPFSMSSILNMQYISRDYVAKSVEQKDLQHRIAEIKNGRVFKLFKEMGYNIRNYSIFDVLDQPAISSKNALVPAHSLLITDKILHNRIIRTSGFLFETGKWAIPAFKKKFYYEHDKDNRQSEQLVLEFARMHNKVPTFIYAHFLMPHWPYYRDSLGNYVDESVIVNESNMYNKNIYLSYLKYTNRVICKIIRTIDANDPSAIVILMSDHGYRGYSLKYNSPFNFDNLVALKLPSRDYQEADQHRSTVNLFRYLFNVGFGQDFPYLTDSTIELGYAN